MALFRFPILMEGLQYVDDHVDLKNKLISDCKANGFTVNNRHIKYINVVAYESRYVYARCLYRVKKCPWRLFYKRKSEKTINQQILNWGQQKKYFLSITNSCLFHNHIPFDDQIPSLKNPPNYMCQWGALHNHMFMPATKLYKYSLDYKKCFKIPGSISRRRNHEVDVHLDHLEFRKWVKKTKLELNIDILCLPKDSDAPEIVVMMAKKSYQIAAWHGQVIGIKKIDPKILQSSGCMEKYKGLIFYQFIPGWKRIAYMFALYSQHNFSKKIQQPYHPIFNLPNPNYTKHQSPHPRQTHLNTNIQKTLQTFLHFFHKKLRTLVLEYDQQIIDTVRYIIDERNKRNSCEDKDMKINWIVDPTYFFADVFEMKDKDCFPIVCKLMGTCSQFQYQRVCGMYWNKENWASAEEKRKVLGLVQHFDLHHQSLLAYTRDKPIYTGGWFSHSTQTERSLQLIIQRQSKPQPMVTVLDKLSSYMVNEVQSYERRPTLIMNIYYEKAYPFTFMKEARINMIRSGFFMLVGEVLQVNTINFVNPCNTVRAKTKIMTDVEEEFDQIFRSEYQKCQNQPHPNPLSIKPSTKPPVQSPFQPSQSPLQSSSLSFQPSSNSHNQTSQAPNENPSILYQTYQQLYPIEPPTSIKIRTPLPPYLQIQDKQQIYICRLIIHSQAWFEEYCKNNYVCLKVDSSYYRVEYRCSCGFREIRGLPCRHLLKICMKYDLAVYPYIESYWKFKESKFQWTAIKYMMAGAPVPQLGRPKLSNRRNRKKYSPGINLFEGYYCEGEKLQIK